MIILSSQDFYDIFALKSFENAKAKINYLTKTGFEDIALKAKKNLEKQFGLEFNFKLISNKYFEYRGDYLNSLKISPNEIGLYDLTIPGEQILMYFIIYTSIPKKTGYFELIHKLKEIHFVVEIPWIFKLDNIRIKEIKTKVKIFYSIKIGIQTPVISEQFLPIPQQCEHEFRLVNNETWEWKLLWQCKHCGFLTYCECFRTALEKSPPPPKGTPVTIYGKEIPLKYPGLVFYPNACDVCRGEVSQHMYCHPMYARSDFEKKYGAYVKKRMIELGIQGDVNGTDELSQAIVNEVRELIGHKKIGEGWFNETELYKIVKSIFYDLNVKHHYKPKWLEGLELDIYVEELNLGIEYNGIQHYKPLEHWGGKEAYEKVKLRDRKKANLCSQNGVLLVIFRYDESIDKLNVFQKLRTMLEKDKKRWNFAEKYFIR